MATGITKTQRAAIDQHLQKGEYADAFAIVKTLDDETAKKITQQIVGHADTAGDDGTKSKVFGAFSETFDGPDPRAKKVRAAATGSIKNPRTLDIFEAEVNAHLDDSEFARFDRILKNRRSQLGNPSAVQPQQPAQPQPPQTPPQRTGGPLDRANYPELERVSKKISDDYTQKRGQPVTIDLFDLLKQGKYREAADEIKKTEELDRLDLYGEVAEILNRDNPPRAARRNFVRHLPQSQRNEFINFLEDHPDLYGTNEATALHNTLERESAPEEEPPNIGDIATVLSDTVDPAIEKEKDKFGDDYLPYGDQYVREIESSWEVLRYANYYRKDAVEKHIELIKKADTKGGKSKQEIKDEAEEKAKEEVGKMVLAALRDLTQKNVSIEMFKWLNLNVRIAKLGATVGALVADDFKGSSPWAENKFGRNSDQYKRYNIAKQILNASGTNDNIATDDFGQDLEKQFKQFEREAFKDGWKADRKATKDTRDLKKRTKEKIEQLEKDGKKAIVKAKTSQEKKDLAEQNAEEIKKVKASAEKEEKRIYLQSLSYGFKRNPWVRTKLRRLLPHFGFRRDAFMLSPRKGANQFSLSRFLYANTWQALTFGNWSRARMKWSTKYGINGRIAGAALLVAQALPLGINLYDIAEDGEVGTAAKNPSAEMSVVETIQHGANAVNTVNPYYYIFHGGTEAMGAVVDTVEFTGKNLWHSGRTVFGGGGLWDLEWFPNDSNQATSTIGQLAFGGKNTDPDSTKFGKRGWEGLGGGKDSGAGSGAGDYIPNIGQSETYDKAFRNKGARFVGGWTDWLTNPEMHYVLDKDDAKYAGPAWIALFGLGFLGLLGGTLGGRFGTKSTVGWGLKWAVFAAVTYGSLYAMEQAGAINTQGWNSLHGGVESIFTGDDGSIRATSSLDQGVLTSMFADAGGVIKAPEVTIKAYGEGGEKLGGRAVSTVMRLDDAGVVQGSDTVAQVGADKYGEAVKSITVQVGDGEAMHVKLADLRSSPMAETLGLKVAQGNITVADLFGNLAGATSEGSVAKQSATFEVNTALDQTEDASAEVA